jgi:chromosome segregation ATPase
MTIAVVKSKTDLDQVFDEVEDAQADVDARRGAVQTAEEEAGAAKGLTAAAQRDLKNAEARLRVLELAQAGAESKDPGYAKLVQQLQAASAKYAEAEKQATAVREAREALAEINTAVGEWVTTATQAAAAFGNSADNVYGLSVADDAEAQKRTVGDALRNQGTSLESELGQLGAPQKQRLIDADRKLEGSAPSQPQLDALKREMTRLDGQCKKAQPMQDKAPSSREVKKAQADYEAAKTAVDEAPEVERDRQAKLQLTREKLAAAEDRLTSALVGKDEAERRLIEDIELTGPGADGYVIAEAKLRYKYLPDGYSLKWTVGGVSVPATEKTIRIDTKELAAGSYVIAVHLHRDSTTHEISKD